jgi:hypothetical protein
MRMIPLLLLLACAGDEKDDTSEDTDSPAEDSDTTEPMDTDPMGMDTDMAMATDEELAADLWDMINGFDAWPQVDPWMGIQHQSDTSPHGPYVQIWLNTTANGDWTGVKAGETFSHDAILVKRLYDDADGMTVKPEIFAMWKIPGYDAANGDWFWAKYDEAGVAGPYGKVEMCSGCHASGMDYSRIATDVPGAGM